MSNPHTKFLINLLKPYVGYTFDSLVEDGCNTVGLKLKNKSGKEIVFWILSDEEGNGPGFIDIQQLT